MSKAEDYKLELLTEGLEVRVLADPERNDEWPEVDIVAVSKVYLPQSIQPMGSNQ